MPVWANGLRPFPGNRDESVPRFEVDSDSSWILTGNKQGQRRNWTALPLRLIIEVWCAGFHVPFKLH